MGKLKYLARRISEMDFSALVRTADRVASRSRKNRWTAMLDIVWCGLRYQAGYMDYDVFQLERANGRQRKTYITRGVNNGFVQRFNDPAYFHIFSNKDEFNAAFSDFLGRDWMRIEEGGGQAFAHWLSGKPSIIAKPRDGMCGKGVEKLYPAEYADADELFRYLIGQQVGLVEECLRQHEDMNRLYPNSINTARIVTLYFDGRTRVVCAYLRIGNGGVVDNFNSGGMLTRIDVETGALLFDAVDKAGTVYAAHPLTGTPIKGFVVPHWQECLALVTRAAQVVPQIGYVGWDVASTPDGPVLVEGNEFPGHDIYQMPAHTPDNYGLLPLFQKILQDQA